MTEEEQEGQDVHTSPEEGHPAGDGPRSDRDIGGPTTGEETGDETGDETRDLTGTLEVLRSAVQDRRNVLAALAGLRVPRPLRNARDSKHV